MKKIALIAHDNMKNDLVEFTKNMLTSSKNTH